MQQQDGAVSLISKIKTLTNTTNGIRIIANLHSDETPLLMEFRAFKAFLEREIRQYESLRKSAEFYHNFAGEGFAGIDCFRNSHISVRTYPGGKDVIFDLFLSNDLTDNLHISHRIFENTVAFFGSKVLHQKITQC
jgi:S-adenosylmethionine/arginine decarboxylase-like enzyme